jgi:signal transduction histidine kinase
MLRFHAAMEKIPHSEPARELMSNALKRADDVLIEGRDRICELRSSARESDYLPGVLEQKGTQLVRIFGNSLRLTVEGAPCPLRPRIAEEIERIGGEVLDNAFHRGLADRIEVQLQYAPDCLSLSVSDDGTGLEHLDLARMHDRARRIHARLEVTSCLGRGTAITLHVGGSVAFEGPASVRRYWLWLLLGRG